MRYRSRAWSRPPLAALLGAALVTTLSTGAPGHADTDAFAPTDEQPFTTGLPNTAAAPTTVTLITGDRIHLHEVPGGRQTATVEPASRPNGFVPQFHITSRDDEIHVVPTDVQALIPGRLDAALFNVTSLVEQGLDDDGSPVLPLILDYPDDQPRTLSSAAVAGTEPRLELDSVNAVAVDADRDVPDLGQAVMRLAQAASEAQGSAQPLDAAEAGPLADVQKIWLDARIEAELDRSTGQISAPAAWEAGFDGTGVSVAVLDTGIDETHPDLAGKVDAAANFTEEDEADDGHGHGTHVASTVAGTGAASGGERRGVAPGARLLDGKVLDNSGSGFVSWAIAGMEWAAGEQGADVVNMSLGLPPGHVEAPLLTGAVEALSAEHGTLFVIAAGNAGCNSCVGSPGDAPSALTVGAVDRDDELAEFSSRGPLHEGYGMKPDITAPGVEISAARATGTGGAEGPYAAYSGTSMAAPHVAGAAAVLAQARPGLTGAQLKGALMSTAVPTDGLTVFEQGTGRVDLGRAVSSTVLASPGSLDFGLVPFPGSGAERLHRTVTYRNVSEQTTTLKLSAQAAGVADGDLIVEPAQLVIEPGATASAEVVLRVEASMSGQFTGHVVAESVDRRLRTPLGFFVEEEHFDLTLHAVARDGRPALPWANRVASPVVDVQTGEQMYEPCQSEPEGLDRCVRVPAGTYSVMTYVFTKAGWAPSDGNAYTTTPLHSALVGDPEVRVTDDTTVVLDARRAVEVEVETPDHDARANLGGAAELMWTRTPEDGPTTTDYLYNYPGAQLEERLFMQPTEQVSTGLFSATSRWRLEAPTITMHTGATGLTMKPMYYRAAYFSDNSWQFPMLDGTFELPVVSAGQGRAEEIGALELDGALALIRRSDDVPVAEASNRAAAAGARLVAVYNDEPGPNDMPGPLGQMLEAPTVRLTGEEGTALLELLEAGPVAVTATGVPSSPFVYDLVYAERGGISADLHHVADTDDLAAVERDFHTQLEGTLTELSWPFEPNVDFATGTAYPLRAAPAERTDYHVPDAATVWEYGVTTPQDPYNYLQPHPFVTPLRLSSDLVTYDQPGRHQQSWLRQPLTPGFDAEYPVARQGDLLVIPTAGYVDAGGNFATAAADGFGKGYDGLFRVWHGDELLGEASGVQVPSGTIRLPAEENTYRITYSIENNTPWASLSTRASTEWTFSSARTDPDRAAPIALPKLDYDLGLDLANRMLPPRERRGPNEVEVIVGHEGGVEIPATGVTFAISYDDGRSWEDLRVRKSGENTYSVHLRNRPPSENSGFISLRVGAVDVEGNRIDQEIIRAAALPAR